MGAPMLLKMILTESNTIRLSWQIDLERLTRRAWEILLTNVHKLITNALSNFNFFE